MPGLPGGPATTLDAATLDLAACFAGLVRYHVATLATPLPEDAPGITWVWGRDGIYKRGQDAARSVLVKVADTPPVSGLAPLLPGVMWRAYPRRLPGQLLSAMLAHARKAAAPAGSSGVLRPVEQQYHVTLEGGQLRVRVPPQDATPGRVAYELPNAPVLLDLHSHHAMQAFFSGTDNRDDDGLGVSAVIGTIFTQPTIICRLCCYGDVQRVPALTLFDSLGLFVEAPDGANADNARGYARRPFSSLRSFDHEATYADD